MCQTCQMWRTECTCRRLYVGVVRSMALYGTPVQTEFLTANGPFAATTEGHDGRAIRGYRTAPTERRHCPATTAIRRSTRSRSAWPERGRAV